MDTKKYLEKFTEKSNQIKQKIQEGNEEISVEDFYNLANYERSISFYSGLLNTKDADTLIQQGETTKKDDKVGR